MTLSYPWTFRLVRERAVFTVARRRKLRQIDSLLVSLGVMVWTLMENEQRGLATLALLSLLVRATLLYAPPFWLDFLAPPKDKTDWPVLNLTISEEGVAMTRRDKTVLAPWPLLSELVETEGYFFLCGEDTRVIPVPKTAFESEESKAEFLDTVQAALRATRDEKAKSASTLPLGR